MRLSVSVPNFVPPVTGRLPQKCVLLDASLHGKVASMCLELKASPAVRAALATRVVE
jgi:hypothetical protein